MNKKLVAVLMLLAACFMVFAGGRSDASSSDKVVLTVWESQGGPDEFIKQAGAAYTAKNPNVEIKFVNVETPDVVSTIALDGPAGIGPDLFATQHDNLGTLVSQGHVAPVANPEKVKATVLGACSLGATYNGTMYGYPVSAETYALYYNKDLIKEADLPKTWEDLVKYVKDFNAKNPGKQGLVLDIGNAYYSIIFASANGNRLFGASGTDTSSTYLNTADAVKGMTFVKTLAAAVGVPAGDLTSATCDSLFSSGLAAMHITGPWNLKNFADAGINYGVTTLPALPGEKEPAPSFSGIRCMFVSAYSENQEEAAKFAEFLLTDEMQQLRYELTNGALPSIETSIDSEAGKGFLKQLDYAFPMPSIPEMGKFWEAMGAATSNIWNGTAADVQAEMDACNTVILSK